MFNNELSYRVVGQGSCFRLWCLVQCFKLRAHSILRLATVSELNEMGRAQTIVVCRVVECRSLTGRSYLLSRGELSTALRGLTDGLDDIRNKY